MASVSQAAPVQPASDGYGERKLTGWALGSVILALMLTLLLSALDQTIVGTALPKIIGELNGLDRIAWVGTAYLLTSATLIPILGKLSDQFGRKWILIGSVVVFLAGSALCGASQTMNQLIAFRAFQGLGAAGLMGMVFTLIGDIFPPIERPKWQGVFGVVFGISSVVGPLIGGWLTDNGPLLGTFITNESRWRWVFYVNLPVGVLALLALVIWLPSNISTRTSTYSGWQAVRRVDFLGTILAAAATVCLLLGLTWGSMGVANGGYDWNSQQIVGILIASVVLFIAFAINEMYAREPIIPLSLFKNRVIAVDAILSLLLGMAFLSVVYYLPTFVQGPLRQAATNSGIVVTPLTFTLIFASIVGGRLISKYGRYQWLTIVGAIILLGGTFLLSTINADTPVLNVTGIMLVLGLGIGCLMPTLTLVVQNAVDRTQLGVATSAVTYLRSLGSTLGIAIIGTVINSNFATELNKRFPALPANTPASAVSALKNQNVLESALTTTTGHDQLYHTATQNAVNNAIAQATAAGKIPATGPAHDQAIAAITHQVTVGTTTMLNQVLEAGRQALATSIVDGFKVGLIVCTLVLIGTFFLKDTPLKGAVRKEAGSMEGEGALIGSDAPEPFVPAVFE